MAGIGTQGTTIEIDTSPPPHTTPAWTTVGNATAWSGPSFTRNEIDVTALDSVAKEYILGLKDPGEFSMDVNVDKTDPGQEFLWGELNQNVPIPVKMTWPSTPPDGFTFEALVMNFETSGSADDKIDGTITLRVTGDVTQIAVLLAYQAAHPQAAYRDALNKANDWRRQQVQAYVQAHPGVNAAQAGLHLRAQWAQQPQAKAA
jgi:hypothetical protein